MNTKTKETNSSYNNNEQFWNSVNGVRARCDDVLKVKGNDYSGNVDRYKEFKDTAERTGLTKYQVLAVYLNKHINSIFMAIRNNPYKPNLRAEHISEKIIDAHNYLYFLSAILESEEDEEAT